MDSEPPGFSHFCPLGLTLTLQARTTVSGFSQVFWTWSSGYLSTQLSLQAFIVISESCIGTWSTVKEPGLSPAVLSLSRDLLLVGYYCLIQIILED